MVVSVHIPHVGSRREEGSGGQGENDQQQLANRLQEIKLAIDTEKEHDKRVRSIPCGRLQSP